ncbi:MAG: hypothetical protein ABW223_10080 [Rariglobus sp.]
MSITVQAAGKDLLSKLGIMPGESVSDLAKADVVQALNWALQTMWKAGAEYFTREAIPVTLIAGQSSYALATTTQAVLGPVKTRVGHLLRRVVDFGDVQNFGMLYMGQNIPQMPNGAPLGFHVRDARTDADNPHLVTLFVMPAPDADAVIAHSPLSVDGVKICASYTVADLESTAKIQVAEGYAESLFLPLARMQITRSVLFSQSENLPRILEDAQLAMQTLGLEPAQKPDGGGPKAQ